MKFLQHKLLTLHRKWVCGYKPHTCVRDGVCARLLLRRGCRCTDTIGKRHCRAQLVPILLLCRRASVCHCWRSVIVPLVYDAIDTLNSSTVWGASQIVMVNATMLSLCYLIMVDTPSRAIGMNLDLKGHGDQSSKTMTTSEGSWEPHTGLLSERGMKIKERKGLSVYPFDHGRSRRSWRAV